MSELQQDGQKFDTREGWLNALVQELRPYFKDRLSVSVPPRVMISCGWPATGGTRIRNKTVGQCFYGEIHSKGKAPQLFIHPGLNADEAAHVTVHELLHACLDSKIGHKAEFAKKAKLLGLEGKPTATVPGDALKGTLQIVIDKLGPYPHDPITYTGKKQGTRLLKIVCPDCGFVARTTAKWLDEIGTPTCACGTSMVEDNGSVEVVALKTVEAAVEYEVDDPRFSLRFNKRLRRDPQWLLIDYDADGETQIHRCEDRQEALDLIEAIKVGLFTYPVQTDEEEDVEEVDEFALAHEAMFDALAHPIYLPAYEDEVNDNPEQDEPDIEDWDYEAQTEKSEISGARKSEQIGNGDEEAMD